MKHYFETKDLSVGYNGSSLIHDINIGIEKGKILTLIGPNGAGKTSTLKVISGLLKPTAGEIIFNGKSIGGKASFKIAKMGIMQSPEGRHVLVGLTVEENLRVGGYKIKSKKQLMENFERVYALFPRLKERAKQQASTLSGGEQQMLAIGRALMGSPEFLILDEPSLGLAPLLVKDIFNTLVKIKEEGTTILVVEQNALSTLKIADYAYVLELGKISMHGKAEDLIKDERLIAAYLGK